MVAQIIEPIKGRLIARQGEWYYFLDVNNHLNKVRIDGTGRFKLNQDYPQFIIITENWIYYSCINENRRIIRLQHDGRGRTRINEDESWCLNSVDDWLYYININDKRMVYKIRYDGTERSKITEDSAASLCLAGRYLYYTNRDAGGMLFRIELASGRRSRLNDIQGGWLNISDDWLYYINNADNNRIYKARSDGSAVHKLDDGSAEALTLAGDRLYFIDTSDGRKLYKMQTNGENRQIVSHDRTEHLSVCGNQLYYSDIGNDSIIKTLVIGEHEKEEPTELLSANILKGYISKGRFITQYGGKIYYYNDAWLRGSSFGEIIQFNTDGSECRQISEDNSEYVIIRDEWLYYSNKGDGGKIYKIRTDGSGQARLNNNRSVHLRISGDWIYYINENDKNKIYKVRLDGSVSVKVIDDGASMLTAEDGMLFYINYRDKKLYKYDADGGSSIKLTDEKVYEYFIAGAWLYFRSQEGRIYKIGTDGSNPTNLNDSRARNIVLYGDWIYYQNTDDHDRLYRTKIDGKSTELITDDSIKHYCVAEERVYYIISGEGGEIYGIHTDGTNKEKINNESCEFINVIGGWIYYNNVSDNEKLYKMRTDGSKPSAMEYEINTATNKASSATIAEKVGIDAHVDTGMGKAGFKKTSPHAREEAIYGRFVADRQGRFYYKDDRDRLYSVQHDGSERLCIIEDAALWINITDDWIYYSNKSDGYKLYKISTAGGDAVRINEFISFNICLYGDWLYYSNISDSSALNKICLDGSNNTKISNIRAGQFIIVDDWVYYINKQTNNYIYKARTDGSEPTKLNYSISSFLNYANGTLYYCSENDGGKIYKLNVENRIVSRLNAHKSWDINVANEWIYYCNKDDNDKVYMLNASSGACFKVNETQSWYLKIIGEWLYFSKVTEGKKICRLHLTEKEQENQVGSLKGTVVQEEKPIVNEILLACSGDRYTGDQVILPTRRIIKIADLEIGSKVVDYSWYWEFKKEPDYEGFGELKPVVWIVVGRDHYEVESQVPNVTLLAEELIANHCFDESKFWGKTLTTWAKSGLPEGRAGLRLFLNGNLERVDTLNYHILTAGTLINNRSYYIDKLNNNSTIILKREPNNEYDPYAIAVLDENHSMLGYIPKELAAFLAGLMDHGKEPEASIINIQTRAERGPRAKKAELELNITLECDDDIWDHIESRIHGKMFFYNAFSDSFKQKVLMTRVPNRDANTGDLFITNDKVFVLSHTEINSDIGSSPYKTQSSKGIDLKVGTVLPFFAQGDRTTVFQRRVPQNCEGFRSYWTRTTCISGYQHSRYYIYSGNILKVDVDNDRGSIGEYIGGEGVRPALNIKADTLVVPLLGRDGEYEILPVEME